jgi:hypothetical protein
MMARTIALRPTRAFRLERDFGADIRISDSRHNDADF